MGFRFAHALVRDAVYKSLLKQRRRDLHRRAADWFADRDPILHAEHLDRAEAPEAAMAYLAAAKAQLGDYRARVRGRCWSVAWPQRARAEDLFALSACTARRFGSRSHSRSAAVVYASAGTGAGRCGRCQAWLGLAACRRMTDDLGGAQADLELAEAAATRLNLPDVLARLHFLAAISASRAATSKAVFVTTAKALPRSGVWLRAARGGCPRRPRGCGLCPRPHALRPAHFERCLELCHEHGLGRIAAAHRQMLGLTRFFCNDVRGALADAVATADRRATSGSLAARWWRIWSPPRCAPTSCR